MYQQERHSEAQVVGVADVAHHDSNVAAVQEDLA